MTTVTTEQHKPSPTRKQQEIVQSLYSYTELSPSGTGLHILTYGQLPGKGIHTAIEMYGQDRFTTITTQHRSRNTTDNRTATGSNRRTLSAICTSSHETTNQNTRGGVGSGDELTELPPEAEHDAVLQRLLSGDISGYPSPSNADFVLILKLVTGQGIMWN